MKSDDARHIVQNNDSPQQTITVENANHIDTHFGGVGTDGILEVKSSCKFVDTRNEARDLAGDPTKVKNMSPKVFERCSEDEMGPMLFARPDL
jgi:hypothetical protein